MVTRATEAKQSQKTDCPIVCRGVRSQIRAANRPMSPRTGAAIHAPRAIQSPFISSRHPMQGFLASAWIREQSDWRATT